MQNIGEYYWYLLLQHVSLLLLFPFRYFVFTKWLLCPHLHQPCRSRTVRTLCTNARLLTFSTQASEEEGQGPHSCCLSHSCCNQRTMGPAGEKNTSIVGMVAEDGAPFLWFWFSQISYFSKMSYNAGKPEEKSSNRYNVKPSTHKECKYGLELRSYLTKRTSFSQVWVGLAG